MSPFNREPKRNPDALKRVRSTLFKVEQLQGNQAGIIEISPHGGGEASITARNVFSTEELNRLSFVKDGRRKGRR